MYDDQPGIYEDLQPAWDAWEELTFSRDWYPGGDPAGIRHSEIVAWLDLNMYEDPALRTEVYKNIKRMDLMWLSLRPKHTSNERNRRGNSPSRNRGQKRARR